MFLTDVGWAIINPTINMIWKHILKYLCVAFILVKSLRLVQEQPQMGRGLLGTCFEGSWIFASIWCARWRKVFYNKETSIEKICHNSYVGVTLFTWASSLEIHFEHDRHINVFFPKKIMLLSQTLLKFGAFYHAFSSGKYINLQWKCERTMSTIGSNYNPSL